MDPEPSSCQPATVLRQQREIICARCMPLCEVMVGERCHIDMQRFLSIDAHAPVIIGNLMRLLDEDETLIISLSRIGNVPYLDLIATTTAKVSRRRKKDLGSSLEGALRGTFWEPGTFIGKEAISQKAAHGAPYRKAVRPVRPPFCSSPEAGDNASLRDALAQFEFMLAQLADMLDDTVLRMEFIRTTDDKGEEAYVMVAEARSKQPVPNMALDHLSLALFNVRHDVEKGVRTEEHPVSFATLKYRMLPPIITLAFAWAVWDSPQRS